MTQIIPSPVQSKGERASFWLGICHMTFYIRMNFQIWVNLKADLLSLRTHIHTNQHKQIA